LKWGGWDKDVVGMGGGGVTDGVSNESHGSDDERAGDWGKGEGTSSDGKGDRGLGGDGGRVDECEGKRSTCGGGDEGNVSWAREP
jgi:hypothetical protein